MSIDDLTSTALTSTVRNEDDRYGPLFAQSGEPTLRFMSLGSGSSGNAYYLEYKGVALLIDAGIAPRTMLAGLRSHNIDMSEISAILVTHDHADHVRSVGFLATKYGLPVYSSPRVCESLATSRYIQQDLSPFLRPVKVGTSHSFGEIKVYSFPVPHDSTYNVGYTFDTPEGRLSIITDVGHITDEIKAAVAQSHFLVFESNYDPEMLAHGPYPIFLKNRITSGLGHLSNVQAAEFLAQNYHMDLKFVALCHLSKHNNHPDLAVKTMVQRLNNEGIRVGRDIRVVYLGRSVVSPIYRFRRYNVIFDED